MSPARRIDSVLPSADLLTSPPVSCMVVVPESKLLSFWRTIDPTIRVLAFIKSSKVRFRRPLSRSRRKDVSLGGSSSTT